MRKVIADYTGIRKGTHIEAATQIEVCGACGRKGRALRTRQPGQPTTVEVLHKITANMVGDYGIARVEQCTTVETIAPGLAMPTERPTGPAPLPPTNPLLGTPWPRS